MELNPFIWIKNYFFRKTVQAALGPVQVKELLEANLKEMLPIFLEQLDKKYLTKEEGQNFKKEFEIKLIQLYADVDLAKKYLLKDLRQQGMDNKSGLSLVKSLVPKELKPVIDAVEANPSLIDKFLGKNNGEEQKEIAGW